VREAREFFQNCEKFEKSSRLLCPLPAVLTTKSTPNQDCFSRTSSTARKETLLLNYILKLNPGLAKINGIRIHLFQGTLELNLGNTNIYLSINNQAMNAKLVSLVGVDRADI